jgi:hydrogenase maturation protein HypF
MLTTVSSMTTHNERARAVIRGAVQGVGFRPFVYRLARELNLTGWVLNTAQGVFLEVEGVGASLRNFLLRVEREKPPRAVIQSMEFSFLDAAGYTGFAIRKSDAAGAKSALILPDIAPCEHCLVDIFSPSNRRFHYPFTNCTHCGPRFSIVEDLPYDRARTAMKKFTMCPACQREYDDPADRRFHAQPNACPACGPQVEFWDADGNTLASGDAAVRRVAEEIRAGRIIALKGLGGFHLLADARDELVVKRLRKRKQRAEKPFALMYPSLALARRDCHISQLEERLLLSPEAPIVLLSRWSPPLAPSIAPGNPTLGAMLPSTPLHHLLMRDLGFPIVCTSGNLSDEPICIDEREALQRLDGIADYFLVHNRPIVRPMDDSVVRVVRGREMVLRRARGYAPLPVQLTQSVPPILAVGAHLKNTVALSVGHEAFISQHIGDLESGEALASFHKTAADLPRLYDVVPEIIACDLHPDYLSTKHAAQLAAETDAVVHPVQHHWAHVLACMAENEVPFPALGVVWDGAGYGTDGTIWGGEFLLARADGFERFSHLRQFRLTGGEAAIRQPRRAALGVLHEMGGAKALDQDDLAPFRDFPEDELAGIRQMLAKDVDSPATSSAGRLFDAVAALTGIRQQSTFEGQSAMELEFAVQSCVTESYDFEIKSTAPSVVDWCPMLRQIVGEVRDGVPAGVIAAKFHNTLVEMIVEVARHAGETRVVLSGGCFQNRYLTERTVQRLLESGFRPYWHQRVPTNDGGISLGQIVDASRRATIAAVPAIDATRTTKLPSEILV